MNAAEAAALRQACEHVEDHRLAAMADVVVAGGTLAAATDAVRTSTSFGALTESGEIHATSAGLRVRLGDRAQRSRELFVTWGGVAAALMPSLRSDLGVEVVAAYDHRRHAEASQSAAARDVARHRWRQVKADVLDTAFSTVAVQPSLFDTRCEPRRLRGQRPSGPGR